MPRRLLSAAMAGSGVSHPATECAGAACGDQFAYTFFQVARSAITIGSSATSCCLGAAALRLWRELYGEYF